MPKATDARDPRDDRTPGAPARPARSVWTPPALVEYGHLAKLTRGSSGNKGEAGGMMPCL